MYFCKQNWLLLGVLLLSLAACSGQKGFDEICLIYNEAKSNHMTKQAMSKYIFDNISTRVDSEDALEAHSAILQLPANKRYSIFKQAAEESLKRKWECQTMQALMSQ